MADQTLDVTMTCTYVCGACLAPVEFSDWDDGCRSWRCPCGQAHGIQLDGGTIDLDAVRDAAPGDDASDFQVFA